MVCSVLLYLNNISGFSCYTGTTRPFSWERFAARVQEYCGLWRGRFGGTSVLDLLKGKSVHSWRIPVCAAATTRRHAVHRYSARPRGKLRTACQAGDLGNGESLSSC